MLAISFQNKKLKRLVVHSENVLLGSKNTTMRLLDSKFKFKSGREIGRGGAVTSVRKKVFNPRVREPLQVLKMGVKSL